MEADLQSMKEAETAAVAAFESLTSSKTKQMSAGSQAIEEISTRFASSKVELVNTKADLQDTQDRLQSDQNAYGQTTTRCQKRDAEYGNLKKELAQERVALADTIKILADDQATETFKKTNVINKDAAASFLQLGSSSHHRRLEALHMLQDTSAQHPD